MQKVFIFLTTTSIILFSMSLSAQNKVSVKEAYKHVGETVTVCGTIPADQLFFDAKTRNTYLLLGEGAGKRVTIVIPSETSKKVIKKPKNYYANRNVCVTGKILELNGKPEMVVNNENKIWFEDNNEEGVEVRPNDFMRFQ